jgi:GH25 family lysozyme M1 (1,4-beta-N-acetylmuramidase)
MNGLDVSFSAHLVTPAWCAARKAEGWDVLICNAWTGNQSPKGVEQALWDAREAGMITEAYYVPHAFQTPEYHLAKARQAIGAEWEHLRHVYPDVEDIRSGDSIGMQWQPAHLRDSLNLIIAAGGTPGIYTGRGVWLQLGNWQTFNDVPLWDANYLTREWIPYGGWAERYGHQYQGTTNLDGVEVDLNTFTDPAVAVDWYAEMVEQLNARWREGEALVAQGEAIKNDVVATKMRLGIP